MDNWLNLLEDTKTHFSEGARSVKAYTSDKVYIITKAGDNSYWVALEEPGFPKKKAQELEEYFVDVFGIEAMY